MVSAVRMTWSSEEDKKLHSHETRVNSPSWCILEVCAKDESRPGEIRKGK